MIIYIGADHRGFKLKEVVKEIVKGRGYEVIDVGNIKYDETDEYPDFAAKIGARISVEYLENRGILMCGSGVGMDVVANKFPNVRAALVGTPDQAFDSRNDDDANVLVLAADHVDSDKVRSIVLTWLETPFSGEERFIRRLKKIINIETALQKQAQEEFERQKAASPEEQENGEF